MSSCKDRCSRFLLIFAVYLMFQMPDQRDCTVPINHWVVVMWCLLCTKYLTMADRPADFEPMSLLFGNNCSNPIIFYWLVVGIRYLCRAEGESCFARTTFSVVVFQMIVGASTILLFLIGMVLLALVLLNKLLYHCLRLFFTRERLDRMPFFQRVYFLPRRTLDNDPVSLSTSQIEELKQKVESTIQPEEETLAKFAENPCSICLDHLVEGNCYITLKCKHFFHTKCLEVWLAQKSLCPLCKEEVKVEEYQNHSAENTCIDSTYLMTEGASLENEINHQAAHEHF